MIFWTVISVLLVGLFVGYMAINKVTTPYEKWKRDDFMQHFEKHENIINLCYSMKLLYHSTVYSEKWNPSEEFNGCSIVQDKYHPCPDCWIHDYLWVTGQGGYLSDRLFYELMIASGMKKGRAWWRWILVRIGWIFYYKWYHFFKRNVNEFDKEFIDVIKELKISKKYA